MNRRVWLKRRFVGSLLEKCPHVTVLELSNTASSRQLSCFPPAVWQAVLQFRQALLSGEALAAGATPKPAASVLPLTF